MALAEGGVSPAALDLAYGDVLSAWQDYMAHYNNGRGVVLIGHSQGTMMLIRLVTSEIDPNPSVRARLVSALLIGGNVKVAVGQDVGGDFQNVPACRSARSDRLCGSLLQLQPSAAARQPVWQGGHRRSRH